MENVMEFAALKEIEDSGRERTTGHIIAWVIGIAIVLLIIAAIWNRSCANQMERGRDNCQTANRLGIIEGNLASVDKVLTQVVPTLNETGRAVTAVTVGLDGWVNCANKEFGHLYGGVNRLDNAVFAPRFCEGREGFSGCGRRGGRPEFERAITYGPPTSDNVVVRQGCGSEFN